MYGPVSETAKHKICFYRAKEMMIKCQCLLKSQSDCLLFGEEDFVLCNPWQEASTRGKKSSSSFRLHEKLLTLVCLELLSAGGHGLTQVWFLSLRFLQIKYKQFGEIGMSELNVFSPVGILNFLWLWNEGRRNWTQ